MLDSRFKSQFSMASRIEHRLTKHVYTSISFGQNKDQILDGIKLETKAAVFDLRAAQKLIEVQEGIIEEAAEALRIANAQHETGMITGVELTDVEMSHTQAQVNQLQAIHDYIVAVARVERAIGSKLD